MRDVNLYAYNANSEGAAELCEALGIRRIRHQNSNYVGGQGKMVINWGSSRLPDIVLRSRVLNRPNIVAQMSNKRTFFEAMDATDCRTPEWTTDRGVAFGWWGQGDIICARAVLNGHSGNGLTIHNAEEREIVNLPNVPLYTKYVKKKAEYRAHFVGGQVIDIQRKIKRPGFQGTVNWHVRNHDNGFIYVRNGVREALPQDVLVQAQHCIANSGLDFGAVDIIYNEQQDQAYVLEVNTAPGLTGETVTNYAEAFRRLLNQ